MGILAKIKTQLSKHFLIIEFCHTCGVKQPLVWWCKSNELWKEITGNDNGIYCPKCFDVLANKKGIAIRWIANEEYRFSK